MSNSNGQQLGLTAEEARILAGINPFANWWRRNSYLGNTGMIIQRVGETRLSSFREHQQVWEISPKGTHHALELATQGWSMMPSDTPSARNTDPSTSHASANSVRRKMSSGAQEAKMLKAYLAEMTSRGAS